MTDCLAALTPSVALTPAQRRVLLALTSSWQSNSEVAARANVSEGHASRTLRRLAKAGRAVSITKRDNNDDRTTWRLWKRA